MQINPPLADKKEHWRNLHGDAVLDNYYWMYDFFGKGPDSEEVVRYLTAENDYVEQVLGHTKSFQDLLFTEMKSRIKEKDETPPVFKNGYFYYTRTEDGQQYYKYCRRKGDLNAQEEILLDVDQMASGYAYFAATGFKVSEDNKLLAYGIDTVSRRQYSIHVKNLETGEVLDDVIHNTSGDPCWANDHKTFFYTSKNPVTLLSEKIKRHTLGMLEEADHLVYEEHDKSNYIGVYKTKNSKFIFIQSNATRSSELWMLDAAEPDGEFRVFQPRIKDMLYDVVALDNQFLIRTNKDGATNFKLMQCPLNTTAASEWEELIPVRADVLLQDVEAFSDFVVLNERKDGLVRLRVIMTGSRDDHYVDFGEPAYYANLGSNPDYHSAGIRYVYSSLTTPFSTYDYLVNTREKLLIKQTAVLGGYDPSAYITERLHAVAADKTSVPVSLVYKKGFRKNGQAPLLLYAYGSYGHSIDATFSSARLSLLDRGFVYAIAHIRGGQEMGRQWYEDGKMMKKKNTFTDFIDCAHFLVQENYTSPGHLYAMGGSAGGLLMGAIVNMEPELWNGIVAQVPFVDVINTMLDESIPLTTNEFEEWGNPKEAAAYFYMKSYSPYENVERKKYPAILVKTGLHDSQVQYFEPAKWVAKLRDLKTDNNVLLLKTNMEFGHGGASGRFDYLHDLALDYAFLFSLEGISA